MVENNFDLATEVRKMKRFASSRLFEEILRAQKTKRDWDKIMNMNMVHGTKTMSDTYLDN